MDGKEVFFTRIEEELEAFNKQTLKLEKKEIYDLTYKIALFNMLDDIFWELYEEKEDLDYDALLRVGDGILEYLFWEWVSYEDGGYLEKKSFVIGQLKELAERGDFYVVGSGKAA